MAGCLLKLYVDSAFHTGVADQGFRRQSRCKVSVGKWQLTNSSRRCPRESTAVDRIAGSRHLMTNSDLSLELARRADVATIANMSRVLIEYGLQWKWTAKRVEASIRANNVNVLVARINDRIIGFAIMRY